MGKEGWGDNPQDWKTYAGMAWKILKRKGEEGLNPYRGAKALVVDKQTGNDKDEIWRDIIQGNDRAATDWIHDPTTGRPEDVVRSARVPYLAQDKKTRAHYLDHLLVGLCPTSLVFANSNVDWDPAGGGSARLDLLGEFLLKDLLPTPDQGIVRTSRPFPQWTQSIDEKPERDEDYAANAPKFWTFRGHRCQLEKSVLIPILIEDLTSSNNSRITKVWRLLVGYEGGGGW